MSRSEQQFIDLCKKQLEQKFSFGNGRGYTQRDLEMLSAHIAEKTGVTISLSTLKRLWKSNYKQSPQVATLNALAVILGHKNWQGFKLANKNTSAANNRLLRWAVSAVISLMVIGVLIYSASIDFSDAKAKKFNTTVSINGPIRFEASKTVNSGIPNTVIFNYDVSNVVADSFYIQQSWNPDHRVAIDPNGYAVTSIYYESGFHRARLVANDSMIAMQPVHIISNGWEPHLYRSNTDPELVDLKNEKFISNGRLHLDSTMLARRGIDFTKSFHIRISCSKVFDVHSDNFSFSTRQKADRVLANPVCGSMDLIIVTEVRAFMVSLTEKGCEKRAAYQVGAILRKGDTNDLSKLGCDVYQWQELEIQVKDRHAVFFLNGQPTYQETYKQDYGKIMALIYVFDGTGSIDYAKLKDGNGTTIFGEDFER